MDLTLVAANSANCIVAAIIFSTAILGEKFIWKYDLTALLLISLGCATIVMNANTTQTEYTAEEVKDLLKAPRTLIFIGFCLFCIVISVVLLRFMLVRLRRFESDVEEFQASAANNSPVQILAPRERQAAAVTDRQGNGANSQSLLESQGDAAPEEEVQRPARMLIEALNDIDDDLLEQVSARSRTLKYYIKMPLVLTISTSALQSGLTIVFLKLITEMGETGEMADHVGLVITMALAMGLSGAI